MHELCSLLRWHLPVNTLSPCLKGEMDVCFSPL